ncbi:MAG TPA: DMT family transporter [Homoserinimonas sp.]|nr:DMT family transporter [Homoserinimonas sp.]
MPRHVLFGLGAGALWGVTFIAPEFLGPFTTLDLTVVRYLVFGVVSVGALVMLRFNPFRRLDARGWWRIIGLGLAGNTLFYLALSSGVAFAGSAPVALIIGTLPIAMIVAGNLRRRTIAWRRLVGPIAVLAVGLSFTGMAAMGDDGGGTGRLVVLGIGLGFVAVFSWLAYGIVNAEYLVDNPGTGVILWTALTGLGTLITVPPLVVAAVVVGRAEPVAAGDVGVLLFWGLLLGLGSTSAATWLWNKASSGLSTTVLGLLVVSQTVFAMIFVCLLETRLPTPAEAVSILLIVVGVGWGLRATSTAGAAEALRC